jgi:hypothetical protein
VNFLIIKTMSEETASAAKKTRDLLESTGIETVVLVPIGVQKITITEESSSNYTVQLWRDGKELDRAAGFLYFEKCLNYAKTVAKESGLTVKDIDFECE